MLFRSKGSNITSILDFDSMEAGIRIARGDVDAYAVHCVGVIAATATSQDRMAWEVAAAYTPFTAAKALSISSSAAADTAIAVDITYLDANYDLQTATVTTDADSGRTEKATGVTALRVLSAAVASATAPAGTIYIYDAASAVTNGVPDTLTMVARLINATCKNDNTPFYCIPNGYEGYLYEADAMLLATGSASTANDAISFCLRTSDFTTVRLQPTRQIFLATSLGGSTHVQHNLTVPLKLPAKTDIYINYLNATANSLKATVSFDLIIVKSTVLDG